MKTRKTLDHNSLMAEVVQQLMTRFRPSVPAIKRAIDVLIEKEYLERAPDDVRLYHYLS